MKKGDWPWNSNLGVSCLYGCLALPVLVVVLPWVFLKTIWDLTWGKDDLPMD
jgi:hypothetical protein